MGSKLIEHIVYSLLIGLVFADLILVLVSMIRSYKRDKLWEKEHVARLKAIDDDTKLWREKRDAIFAQYGPPKEPPERIM